MEPWKTAASRISARGFSRLSGLTGAMRTLGFLGSVASTETTLARAYGGFADGGVIDDELVALLHVAEGEQGLVVGDAVPGGLAVADEVVEGVFVGFGFE